MLTAAGARADASNNPLTITVAPVWFLNTGSDATAHPPPGTIPLNSPLVPRTTDDVRLDFGANYQFNKKMSLSYAHANFNFSLGRILTIAPGTSLVTGDIADRIDTISFNYGFGHGLNGSVYYLSHQRSWVAGLCLNQAFCPNAAGVNESNPASINMIAYGIGFKYAWGPVSPFTGPLLTFNADAQYVPRPSSNPTANLNGLPAYVGTQTIFPYGVTMNVPIRNYWGIIPFIDYQRNAVLFRGESSQELYNTVEWGAVKILRPDLTFALLESNWKGCVCSDTVPPPDNVRFSVMIAKLTYNFKP
jgi:hypothetical protein